jgi:hypothetical protein
VNSVLTPPRRPSARLAGAAIVLVVLVLSVGVLFALARLDVGESTTYRRLTVDNPSPYNVNIQVAGRERQGWLDLGSFPRQGRRTVEEVADQGLEWVFRFSYGGVDAGVLVISRDQLARDGWETTVPSAVAERLHEAGLQESAG